MNAKNIALKQAQQAIQRARDLYKMGHHVVAKLFLADALIYIRLAEHEA